MDRSAGSGYMARHGGLRGATAILRVENRANSGVVWA